MVRMKYIIGALLAAWICIMPTEDVFAQSFRNTFKQGVRNALNGRSTYSQYNQQRTGRITSRYQKTELKCESKEEALSLARFLRENLQNDKRVRQINVSKKICYVTSSLPEQDLLAWVEKYKLSLTQDKQLADNEDTARNNVQNTPPTTSNTSPAAKTSPAAESKTVTLVVSGEASTKEEATKVALRSAIEQTFGTFVSANTEVLNDEMVKDEIVTISTGNIQSYKELSCIDLENGNKSVSLQAVVSINKLISYAQSKGMTAELAGATFAMNIKMKELNRKNEAEAMKNMVKQLEEIVESGLCDFELIAGEPKLNAQSNLYEVPLTINALISQKTILFLTTFRETLNNLVLSPSEKEEYQAANLPIYRYYGRIGYKLNNALSNVRDSVTRNKLDSYDPYIRYLILKGYSSFSISDNIGNIFLPYDEVSIRGLGSSEKTKKVKLSRGIYYNFIGFQDDGSSQKAPAPNDYYSYNTGLVNNSNKTLRIGYLTERDREMEGALNSGYNDLFLNKENTVLDIGSRMFAWKIYIYYSLDELSNLSSFKVEPHKVKRIETNQHE